MPIELPGPLMIHSPFRTWLSCGIESPIDLIAKLPFDSDAVETMFERGISFSGAGSPFAKQVETSKVPARQCASADVFGQCMFCRRPFTLINGVPQFGHFGAVRFQENEELRVAEAR